jgi:hypothetical protein
MSIIGGLELQFGEMRDNITSERANRIWCEFMTDFIFLAFTLLTLQQ